MSAQIRAGELIGEVLVDTVEVLMGFDDVSVGSVRSEPAPPPESELTAFIGVAGEYTGGHSRPSSSPRTSASRFQFRASYWRTRRFPCATAPHAS